MLWGVEARKTKQGILDLRKRARQKGYHTIGIPARDTGKKGPISTTGGELLLASTTLVTRKLTQVQGLVREAIPKERIVLCTVALKQFTIVLGCVYFHTGVGLEGPNLALLWELRLVLRLMKLPFLLFGDFNIPIQEFIEH